LHIAKGSVSFPREGNRMVAVSDLSGNELALGLS
jgi:hypothetical protein